MKFHLTNCLIVGLAFLVSTTPLLAQVNISTEAYTIPLTPPLPKDFVIEPADNGNPFSLSTVFNERPLLGEKAPAMTTSLSDCEWISPPNIFMLNRENFCPNGSSANKTNGEVCIGSAKCVIESLFIHVKVNNVICDARGTSCDADICVASTDLTGYSLTHSSTNFRELSPATINKGARGAQ